MNKNTESSVVHNEVVNGQLTSESYNTYSALRNPKQKFDFKNAVLYLVFFMALLVSTLIFISSIRTAYFNTPSESTSEESVLKKTSSSYDANTFLKIETVTKDIAEVFGLPVGLKIIDFSDDSTVSTGLKINDIIVKVSGQSVTSIDDFNNAINNMSTDDILTYTVYRNGDYQTINPFDVEE